MIASWIWSWRALSARVAPRNTVDWRNETGGGGSGARARWGGGRAGAGGARGASAKKRAWILDKARGGSRDLMTEKRAAGAFRPIPRRRCDGGGARAGERTRARERAGSGSGTHVVEVFSLPSRDGARGHARGPDARSRGRPAQPPRRSRRGGAARGGGSPGAAAARAARARGEARRERPRDGRSRARHHRPPRSRRAIGRASLARALPSARRAIVRPPERPDAAGGRARQPGGRDETARALKSAGTGKTGLPRDISSVTIAFRRARDVRQRLFSRPPLAAARLRVLPRPPLAFDDVDGRARRRGRADRPPPGDEAKPRAPSPTCPGSRA